MGTRLAVLRGVGPWGILLYALLGAHGGAAAQTTPAQGAPATDYGGQWQASRLIVQWAIGRWSPECGPEPSGGGEPAGTVLIQQKGRELSINGAGRSYSTANCWERAAGMNRVSHSSGTTTWTTTCKTAATDPRQVTIRTTLSGSGGRLNFDETGQYKIKVRGQTCTASSRKTRSFKLINGSAPTEPAVTTPGSGQLGPAGIAKNAARSGFDFGIGRSKQQPGPAGALAGATASATPPNDPSETQRPPVRNPADPYAALLAEEGGQQAIGAPPELVASVTDVLGAGTAMATNEGAARKRWFLLISTGLSLMLGMLGIYQLKQARLAATRGAPPPNRTPGARRMRSMTPAETPRGKSAAHLQD